MSTTRGKPLLRNSLSKPLSNEGKNPTPNLGQRKEPEDSYSKIKTRKPETGRFGTESSVTPKLKKSQDSIALTFGKPDPLSHGRPRTAGAATVTGFTKQLIAKSANPFVEPKNLSQQNSTVMTVNCAPLAGSSIPKLFSGIVGHGRVKEIKPGEGNTSANSKQDVQDYEKLKRKCLDANILFADEEFPAKDASLYFSPSGERRLIWKRPKEISDDPKFFADGVSRFDVCQGELGNCWFLAAVANLTLHENLFYQVVPRDNSFESEYCGIFHFRFWQYGKWVDVVVDDRLPCNPVTGKLCYMHSNDKDEFWGALMEKAYAKLHGSYEALQGGTSNEALQDFCGGIVELIQVKETTEEDIGRILETATQSHSFMCCALKGHSRIREDVTKDGLVQGHAYSMTDVQRVQLENLNKALILIRIRNPWGNDKEWNGPWSDGSNEWTLVSKATKLKLELVESKDGEFWMALSDFRKRFDTLEICNLSPTLFNGVCVQGKKWNESDYGGKWIPWATAGGCSNYIYSRPLTYANNPQYIVEFERPDDDGDPEKCTVLIGLVQKNRRAKRKEGIGSLSIGFSIYEISKTENLSNPLDLEFFKEYNPIANSGNFTNSRVINARFELYPGKYCIVPSTFEPNQEGEFILRVFSESNNTIRANGGQTQITNEKRKQTGENGAPGGTISGTNDEIHALFKTTAGNDQEIGWAKLKKLLDSYLKKEFKVTGFSGEVCRSMVALMDNDRSGKIGPEEFQELWTSVLLWKDAFKEYDEDHSNSLSSLELRNALSSAGIRVSNRILETLVLRYGNDDGLISFEDFIMCAVRLNAMIGIHKEHDIDNKNIAAFCLEDWVETTIYS